VLLVLGSKPAAVAGSVGTLTLHRATPTEAAAQLLFDVQDDHVRAFREPIGHPGRVSERESTFMLKHQVPLVLNKGPLLRDLTRRSVSTLTRSR